jgi:hypothetical protein
MNDVKQIIKFVMNLFFGAVICFIILGAAFIVATIFYFALLYAGIRIGILITYLITSL